MTYIKTKKIIPIIAIILLLSIFTAILPIGTCETTNTTTFYVDDNSNADYTGIQDAINNANNGDTIYVHNGTYKENLVINKQLILIGLNNPIIYNNTMDHTISITVDSVHISGFTIDRVILKDDYAAGIYITSNDNTISDCVIRNHNHAIYLNNANYNVIQDNSFTNINLSGLHIRYSNNNQILRNNIYNNRVEGISLWESNDNVLQENNIINNDMLGIYIGESQRNIIEENIIENNILGGVYLINSDDNTLAGNTVSLNVDGLYLSSSENNIVKKNHISNNKQYGVHMVSTSNNNTIYCNNFVNNTKQASDECNNYWSSIALQQGNYWDDYVENHPTATQIGEIWNTPYNIMGGNNQDQFPLVTEYKEDEEKTNDGETNNIPNFNLIFVFILIICITIVFIVFWNRRIH